jgi:hypothetical protein
MNYLDKFKLNLKDKKDLTILFLFYLIAHGGLLFIPNALYWDDWIAYQSTSEFIYKFVSHLGSALNINAHILIIMSMIGLWAYKLLTFAFFFLAGLLLNLILKKYKNICAEDRFFITIIFLIAPFNIARLCNSVFQYSLSYFIFFLAWYLLGRYRLLTLALFFISFNTNSLLFFYLLPIMDYFYRNGAFDDFKSLIRVIIKNIDFLLLPIIFYIIKIIYYQPYGEYENYNKIVNFSEFFNAPYNQINDIFRFLSNLKLIDSIIYIPVIIYLLKLNLFNAKNESSNCSLMLVIIGLFAFVLASFPYWLAGHTPTFNGWESRHQLLQPLGFALLVVGILNMSFDKKYIFNSTLKHIIIGLIISISINFQFRIYVKAFSDNQKQNVLVNEFSKNQIIKNNNLFIIKDLTISSKNIFNRSYETYVWNGILTKAFGDQKRFGVAFDNLDLRHYQDRKISANGFELYKASDHDYSINHIPVYITIDNVHPKNIFEKIYMYFNPKFIITTCFDKC